MRDVDDTPARLVAAAERLFAEAGEEATSLRAVTRAARSNAAAVHYHFGGRDELTRAVLERQLGPLNVRRLQLLDRAVERHGDPAPVPALLEAVARPDLELLAKLRRNRVLVARFLGRAHTSSGKPVVEFLDGQFERWAVRLIPLLRNSLPDVDAADVKLRLRLCRDVLAQIFATAPDPDQPGPLGTDDVDEQVRRIVAFCAAGLATPSTRTAILDDSRAQDTDDRPRSAEKSRKRKKSGGGPRA